MSREHPLIKWFCAAGGGVGRGRVTVGGAWQEQFGQSSVWVDCSGSWRITVSEGGGGGRGMTVLTLRGGEKDARLPAEQINPSAPLLPTSSLESGLLDKVGVTSFSLLVTLKHPSSRWRTSNFYKGSLWVFFFFYWWALITVRGVFHFSLLICQKQSLALFSCWSWIDWLI